MTDRPIPFSGPMVRALLEGRKTQTRRQAQQTRYGVHAEMHATCSARSIFSDPEQWGFPYYDPSSDTTELMYLPEYVKRYIAAPGDRLYVREHWRAGSGWNAIAPRDMNKAVKVHYEADRGPKPAGCRFRQGMHMPRWASRLTLLVTDVRVQRLQEISEADAQAEGVEMETADPPFWYVPGIHPHSLTAVGIEEAGGRHPQRSFAKLWDMLNATRGFGWDTNPFVAAISFTVHKCNIDAPEAPHG